MIFGLRISIEEILLINSLVIGGTLAFWWRVLWRRGLFHWATAGFWAWASFALYYVLNPLFYFLSDDVWEYKLHLEIAGGTDRAFWILLVAETGITCFFFVYLRTRCHVVGWRLSTQNKRLTVPIIIVLSFFIGLALNSLVSFRSLLIPTAREVVVIEGRFVGQVTGYESNAFAFLFVPVVFLLLSETRFQRLIGWGLGIIYTVLSIPHAWSRYATVSMVLALALVDTVKSNKNWPRIPFILVSILLAAVLQIRGHQQWSLASSGSNIAEIVAQAPGRLISVLGSKDTAMLATWYLESYIKDTITGYDYGIPLINYILTGWIPGRFFPNKYFLVDWLRDIQPAVYSPTINMLMYGAKSSLMGSFYANGGLLGVILLMGFSGFLSRKMDGMVSNNSPSLVRAVGISWMSLLWMVWGSHDFWGISVLGTILIPGLALWLVSPKVISTPHSSQPRSRTPLTPVRDI